MISHSMFILFQPPSVVRSNVLPFYVLAFLQCLILNMLNSQDLFIPPPWVHHPYFTQVFFVFFWLQFIVPKLYFCIPLFLHVIFNADPGTMTPRLSPRCTSVLVATMTLQRPATFCPLVFFSFDNSHTILLVNVEKLIVPYLIWYQLVLLGGAFHGAVNARGKEQVKTKQSHIETPTIKLICRWDV